MDRPAGRTASPVRGRCRERVPPQVTRGDYDHAQPSFSPDGTTIVFASDRHPRRDDRARADAWVVPATGGRPRRLHPRVRGGRLSAVLARRTLVAFAGEATGSWDEDAHVFVVPADRSGSTPELVAPDTDRPVPTFSGLPCPLCWTGERELAMLVGDRGRVSLHRARIGERKSRPVVEGELEIDGFAARSGRRAVAFTASWPDRPSEVLQTCTPGRRGTHPARAG